METKEKYTIAEATKLLGFKSRSTLNKRTKASGIEGISYEKDENGTKVIPLIELQRVFPDRIKQALKSKPDTPNTFTKHSTKAQRDTAKNTANSVWLEQKLDLLNELLEQEKAERARERNEFKERERKSDDRELLLQNQVKELTNTISQQTRLLEDHRPKESLSEKRTTSKRVDQIGEKTLNELNKTLRFIAIAGLVLLALVIAVYWMQ